jgi:hypothetical protein
LVNCSIRVAVYLQDPLCCVTPHQGQQAAYWLLLYTGEHHAKASMLCYWV